MIVLVFIAIGIILACIVLLIGEIRSHLARARSKKEAGAVDQRFRTTKINWPSITWMISLTLLCIGIVAYSYYYPQSTMGVLPYHLGRKMGEGFVIWMIFNVTFGRKQGYKKAALSFLVISGSTTASGLISYRQEESATRQLKTEIQQLLTGPTTNAHGLAPSPEGKSDTASATRGEFLEIAQFTKTLMNKVASQRDDYSRELDASGFKRILDRERLERDITLFESKMIVHKAKEIVAKYRILSATLTESARKDIGRLRVSDQGKRDLARGFDDGVTKWRSQHDAMWDLEAEIVSEVDKIFALLARRRDAWVVQNGQLVFASGRDRSEFESYLNTIEELGRKQDAILKQLIKALEEWMK